MIKNSTPLHWIALSQLPGFGPVKAHRCLEFFENDVEKIFSAKRSDLRKLRLTSDQIDLIFSADWVAAEKSLQWAQKNQAHVIVWTDDSYPPLLREIHAAPILFYVWGDVGLLSQPQLAMVGSRHASVSGLSSAKAFASTLAERGLVITSGLALGIDAASHRGALLTGQTIAVLGTGLGHVYPKQHWRLAEEILAKGGAIMAEYAPDTKAVAKNFPLRNRIISGLSRGVLVVEASLPSGSLITARYALEQNREVFAMPGSIHNPLARGCHHLLRQGAKLVETAEDVLEEFRLILPESKHQKPAKKPFSSVNIGPEQQKVLQETGYELTPLEMIIVRTGLTAAKVSSILLSLELLGCVVAVPGGYVRQG